MEWDLLNQIVYNQLDRKSHPEDQNNLPKDVMNVSRFESLQTILSNIKHAIIKSCKNKNLCSKERCWAPDLNPRWTCICCMILSLSLSFHIWEHWAVCHGCQDANEIVPAMHARTLTRKVLQKAGKFILVFVALGKFLHVLQERIPQMTHQVLTLHKF